MSVQQPSCGSRIPDIQPAPGASPGFPEGMAAAAGPADHRALFAMAVAAELCGVHPQTLRTYERRGLLQPARTPGGTRRYSEADLAVARRIAELSTFGFTLQAIEMVLELETQVLALRAEVIRLHQERAAR